MKFSKFVDDVSSSCYAYELTKALNAEFSNVKSIIPFFCIYTYADM